MVGVADQAFGAVGFHAVVVLGTEPHDGAATGIAVPTDGGEVIALKAPGGFTARVATVGVAMLEDASHLGRDHEASGAP